MKTLYSPDTEHYHIDTDALTTFLQGLNAPQPFIDALFLSVCNASEWLAGANEDEKDGEGVIGLYLCCHEVTLTALNRQLLGLLRTACYTCEHDAARECRQQWGILELEDEQQITADIVGFVTVHQAHQFISLKYAPSEEDIQWGAWTPEPNQVL